MIEPLAHYDEDGNMVLARMAAAGKGTIVTAFGTSVERLMANHTNENPSLGPENQWLGLNILRACAPAYDALVAEMSQTASLEKRASLAKQMNDMLVQNHSIIPLIRRGTVSAHANTLKGVRMNAWDSGLWNLADWHR